MILISPEKSYQFSKKHSRLRMSKRKAGNSDNDNPNKDIVEFLLELSEYEKNVSRNTFKANAYKKAAGVISNLPERVKSGAEVKQFKNIILCSLASALNFYLVFLTEHHL